MTFTLLDPWLLLLALAIPVALWLGARGGRPAVTFAPAAFLLPAGPGTGAHAAGAAPAHSLRARLSWLPPALYALGLLCAVVALARPVERAPLPRTARGVDVVLCVDVSSSMAATDLDPARTRLAVAKAEAARFVAGRPNDRIGLVTFARYPDVRCPPTLDHRALGDVLDRTQLVAAEGPEDATGIGTALLRAAQALRAGAAKGRVIVLLTDGEENVATAETPDEVAPAHAAQACRDLGIRVHAIAAGLGARGRDGRFTPVDTAQIERVAERTGGKFFAARDAAAIAGVYAAIGALEQVEFEAPRFRTEERFAPFAAAAAVLLLLARLLRRTALAVLP